MIRDSDMHISPWAWEIDVEIMIKQWLSEQRSTQLLLFHSWQVLVSTDGFS